MELESESESDDDEKKSTSRKKKQKKSSRSKNASSTDDSESSSSDSDSSPSAHKTPKLKNGYLPKSHTLTSTDDEDEDFEFGEPGESDGGAEGGSRVWHTHEMSISTTREGLEGGGMRTVWVRTDRNVTVMVEEEGGGGTGKG